MWAELCGAKKVIILGDNGNIFGDRLLFGVKWEVFLQPLPKEPEKLTIAEIRELFQRANYAQRCYKKAEWVSHLLVALELAKSPPEDQPQFQEGFKLEFYVTGAGSDTPVTKRIHDNRAYAFRRYRGTIERTFRRTKISRFVQLVPVVRILEFTDDLLILDLFDSYREPLKRGESGPWPMLYQ